MSARGHTLVIGGTKGIGRAIVRILAVEGHNVSVISRAAPSGFEDLPAVRGWSADVSDRLALRSALASAHDAHGRPNGVVLLQRYRGDCDDWVGELETSLTATRNVLEWIGETTVSADEGGAVVVIGSAAASFIASEQPVSYHVAKAGLVQMVRYYAVALGPKGVRLNVISPGTVIKDENQAFYRDNPGLERLYREIIPLRRMGTARDVADLTMFLLSERAAFLTGQNIVLDGGVSLHWHESLARQLSPMKGLVVARPQSRNT